MKTVINYLKAQTGSQPAEIFGIDVAIANFLKAFLRHSRQKQFFFLPGSDDSIEELKNIARAENIDFSRCAWIPAAHPGMNMNDVDVLFRPDPNIADHVWRRQQITGHGYSVCSLVHTMSGERIAGVLSDYITAPTAPGDAIICPSQAIRKSIEALWAIQGEYYKHRFRGIVPCPVDLPVIPLGIHTQRFADATTPSKRIGQREALALADDEVAILHVGRMSYATKAHPISLFKAAEKAAQLLAPKKLRLLMFGFFKPDVMEKEFRQLAADIGKTVHIDFILNNDPRFPDGLWAAGDIFTSLIDNIQESFGFTPIEAMACGLPSVISDWDGYRDGVRHGTDGFLIPTLAVAPGGQRELAAHYFNIRNYGDYLIRSGQSVAIDIDAAATAFRLLAQDDNLRKTMGEASRKRAVSYDWRSIIPAYEDLWAEQAAKRKTALRQEIPPAWQAAHPSYPDPSSMFAAFATRHISPDDRLDITAQAEDIDLIARHRMNIFGMDLLLPEEIISTIMETLYRTPQMRVADVQTTLGITDTPRLMRTLLWFAKMGLLRITQP